MKYIHELINYEFGRDVGSIIRSYMGNQFDFQKVLKKIQEHYYAYILSRPYKSFALFYFPERGTSYCYLCHKQIRFAYDYIDILCHKCVMKNAGMYLTNFRNIYKKQKYTEVLDIIDTCNKQHEIMDEQTRNQLLLNLTSN